MLQFIFRALADVMLRRTCALGLHEPVADPKSGRSNNDAVRADGNLGAAVNISSTL